MTWPLGALGHIAVNVLGANAVITRRSFSAGTNVDGMLTPGASTDTVLSAVVYPATPKELLLLPEGQRTSEVIGIVCVEQLRTADLTLNTEADEIEWDGRRWSVLRSSDWGLQAGFFHALATRVTS